MSLPFTSLSGANSLGAGAAHDLEGISSHHQMFVTVSDLTGSGATVSVVMELSHDNENWYSQNSGTGVGVTADGTYQQQYSGYLARYVRATVTQLDDVTGVSITATVASLPVDVTLG